MVDKLTLPHPLCYNMYIDYGRTVAPNLDWTAGETAHAPEAHGERRRPARGWVRFLAGALGLDTEAVAGVPISFRH